jgi:hypothetical protein
MTSATTLLQNALIWTVADAPASEFVAAHSGGYRVSRDCGAVTAGNEAPVGKTGVTGSIPATPVWSS